MNSIYQQLNRNFGTLKLTQMQLHLNEVADFVSAISLSFSEGLLKLTNYEADYKAENSARSMVKAGVFPYLKELDNFDFFMRISRNPSSDACCSLSANSFLIFSFIFMAIPL